MRLSEIEKDYGVDFGVKTDTELSTYLRKLGYPSLAKCLQMLDMKKKPKLHFLNVSLDGLPTHCLSCKSGIVVICANLFDSMTKKAKKKR